MSGKMKRVRNGGRQRWSRMDREREKQKDGGKVNWVAEENGGRRGSRKQEEESNYARSW